jgi:hypothetical protein
LRILNNGNVGVGTTAPAATLHVISPTTGTNRPVTIFDKSYGTSGDTATAIRMDLNAGSGGGYLFGYSGETVFAHNADFICATGWVAQQTTASQVDQRGGNLYLCADSGLTIGNVFTPTIRLAVLATGNVGIGTTSPTYPLTVNGTVRAKEVIVDTGWSDYVFDPGYSLMPLREVKRRIQVDGHLPGIPSAMEVKTGGISLGEMQARLLQKIEELTLHQIAQEERMQKLEQENAVLRKRLSP